MQFNKRKSWDRSDHLRMRPLRFRVTHLLYATAVIAATLAFAPQFCLYVSAVILGFWFFVFWFEPIRKSLVRASMILVASLALSCLIVPVVQVQREPPSKGLLCRHYLKMIGLGLHNYHDAFGCFPPPFIPDKDGAPMHSWRVLILPYIEQQPLYNAYRFDEPWDGPNNTQLHSQQPYGFQCPASNGNRTDTSYFAILGPDAAWSEGECKRLDDIYEHSGTVMVIEQNIAGVHWMEPRDLSLEEAIDVCTLEQHRETGHPNEMLFRSKFDERNMLSADGSVLTLRPGVPEAKLRRLFSCTQVTGELTAFRYTSYSRTEHGSLVSFVFVACLAILPVIPLLIRMGKED